MGPTLARLIDERLDRHDAVHAIESVLAYYVYDPLKARGPLKPTRIRRNPRPTEHAVSPETNRGPCALPNTGLQPSAARES